MDLPSAAWGAGWLLMVEAVVGVVLYVAHRVAPVGQDRSRDARDLARRKLNGERT